ncbi:MAG TPA: signal peptidase II [Thermoanaerobaculia bacterium]|jgi:signal peptidase II|nr:signal peptidase II [Thermoanaerobaculia bacterium]
MTTRRRIALALIVIITIAADQAAKAVARRTLMNAYPVKRGILTLLHTENPGAFLSLGADLSPNVRHIIFDGLVSVGLVAAAFVLFTGRMQPGTDDVAIAFIVGGGAGNLIDRFRLGGRVTDFLFLQAGPLHTGVFNVADMAITCGVICLALSWMFRKKTA